MLSRGDYRLTAQLDQYTPHECAAEDGLRSDRISILVARIPHRCRDDEGQDHPELCRCVASYDPEVEWPED